MFQRLLQKLEDPKRPFLGPVLKYLTFYGVWTTDNFRKKRLIFHILETIFVFTEIIDVCHVKNDLNSLLTNLEYSMQALVNVCKAWSLILWHKDWKIITEYITKADLENRSSKDLEKRKNIIKFTKYARKLTISYTMFLYITSLAVTCQPVIKWLVSSRYRENTRNGTEDYMQVISSWLPFDKNKLPGVFFAYIIQGFAAMFAAPWITTYDDLALSVMIFIHAELISIKLDCAKIFDDADDTVVNRIKDCYRRHVDLLECCRIYDSCTSPILMIYLFVITVMICATAVQIRLETEVLPKVMTLIYLTFGISQLFLYCWHSNDVYYASMSLSRGPYESKWWRRNASQQRTIIILVGQLSKTIIFTAGPFTNLTVATFISILKGAYSYYTLL